MLAALVGELLCSIGDILLGILFCFNPLSCSPYIEKCSPFNKELIKISELKDLSKEFLEFSELHFVLSRTFSGLIILSFLLILEFFPIIWESILPATMLLFVTMITSVLYSRNVKMKDLIIVLVYILLYILLSTFILVFTLVVVKSLIISILSTSVLILLLIALTYRIQANRIIKQGSKNLG